MSFTSDEVDLISQLIEAKITRIVSHTYRKRTIHDIDNDIDDKELCARIRLIKEALQTPKLSRR